MWYAMTESNEDKTPDKPNPRAEEINDRGRRSSRIQSVSRLAAARTGRVVKEGQATGDAERGKR